MRSLALLALAATSVTGCASIDTAELSRDALATPGIAYDAARRGLAGRNASSPNTRPHRWRRQTMPQPQPVVRASNANSPMHRLAQLLQRSAHHARRFITVEIEIDDSANLVPNRQRTARRQPA